MYNPSETKEPTEGEKLLECDLVSNTSEILAVKRSFVTILDNLLYLRNNQQNSYSYNLIIGMAIQSIISASRAVVAVTNYKH